MPMPLDTEPFPRSSRPAPAPPSPNAATATEASITTVSPVSSPPGDASGRRSVSAALLARTEQTSGAGRADAVPNPLAAAADVGRTGSSSPPVPAPSPSEEPASEPADTAPAPSSPANDPTRRLGVSAAALQRRGRGTACDPDMDFVRRIALAAEAGGTNGPARPIDQALLEGSADASPLLRGARDARELRALLHSIVEFVAAHPDGTEALGHVLAAFEPGGALERHMPTLFPKASPGETGAEASQGWTRWIRINAVSLAFWRRCVDRWESSRRL